jgi:hypothetical protein
MLDPLIQQYRTKGILVDTNLLIALVVGLFNPKHLQSCRGTKNFTPSDFQTLKRFVTQFDLLITTPHVLAEVSNLSRMLPEPLHADLGITFRALLNGPLSELYSPCSEIANDLNFPRFGLTDTAIAMIAPKSHLVLTDDFSLYGLLSKRGVDVLNFNRIRTFE